MFYKRLRKKEELAHLYGGYLRPAGTDRLQNLPSLCGPGGPGRGWSLILQERLVKIVFWSLIQ